MYKYNHYLLTFILLFVSHCTCFCKTTDLKPKKKANMEGNPTPAPKPNAFVIADDEAYAMTTIQTFKAAEFLLTKLEPVNLEAKDAVCIICHQEFRISENVKHSHAPVKTPCGHIFGRKCLMQWLGPLSFWGSKEEHHAEAAEEVDPSPAIKHGKTSCPICRQALVPNLVVEPMESLAQRLALWDAAYSSAGVARSEREDRSRAILWEYVDCCRSMDELEQNTPGAQVLAQATLMRWLHALRSRIVTPQQEYLRQKLIRFAWGSVLPLGNGHR